MIVTVNKLKDLDACIPGIALFQHVFGDNAELKDVIKWASEQTVLEMRYANWLIVRMLDRKHALRYAIYAAHEAMGVFDDDPVPRELTDAITAAEACVDQPSRIISSLAWEAAEKALQVCYTTVQGTDLYYASHAAYYAAYFAYNGEWFAAANAAASCANAHGDYDNLQEASYAMLLNHGITLINDQEIKGSGEVAGIIPAVPEFNAPERPVYIIPTAKVLTIR